MVSLNSEGNKWEISFLMLLFHSSRTLLKGNIPPLKPMQKIRVEVIIFSKRDLLQCYQLGSSPLPEVTYLFPKSVCPFNTWINPTWCHHPMPILTLFPGSVTAQISCSAQYCWTETSQLKLPAGFHHLIMKRQTSSVSLLVTGLLKNRHLFIACIFSSGIAKLSFPYF